MNIIIVAKPDAGTRVFSLSDKRVRAAAGIAAGVVVFGLFALGAWFGAAFIGPRHLRDQLSGARTELVQQQGEVERLNGVVSRDMNALALRLGRIQAETTRLNALGGRLAKLGNLEDGEFNFGSEPDLGGPEHAGLMITSAPAQISTEIGRLERQMASQSRQLSVLEELLAGRQLDASLMPSGTPVRSGYISSRYGYRSDPLTGAPDFHPGIDFDGDYGTEILAVGSGVVSFSGVKPGYGNTIEIDHGNGYVTRYGHNSKNLVAVGDPVRDGDVIGKVGSTGRSTGTHVHFEVWRDGRVINPNEFVRQPG
ncbi:MAG: M23 family metallopeptidase [Rhodanobacteraceae bacterium]|jgi:murein DD-endopeptidase MepM/ murein hydrolase activator NlpD|nr:M23 family metallopeptidase [Rhodanobacteraceae bacterium]MBL0042614.1 M23 family metallopeptidase [Xanthomonadales bacterium]MBP6078728.1 M23 family metallopeptidase [Xanthomonadales bacterium]MBP7623419.1 M23 family metallopeptidase [Xanthomonadales bacterium]